MGKYFGTDGFRGEANVNLTADHAYQVGRFLGWYYTQQRHFAGKRENAKIVIGKDTRRSSYMFEYALIAGLTASGADAYMLHVTTTPSVAWVTHADEFDCGIMISASHNPYYDNGIKLLDGKGEKMGEDTIGLIEDYLDGKLNVFGQQVKELPFATKENIGQTVDYVSGRNRYVGYLISHGLYSFRGLRVGLDCANGASWTIAKAVFEALGARTYVMGAEPNGLNINKGVGSTHIQALQQFVLDNQLDVGFAYDGDADRCLCVDEKGDVLTGDHIMYAYACYMQDRGKLVDKPVVATVMSNFGLFKALNERGIDVVKTKVGDKYVYEYMTTHGPEDDGMHAGPQEEDERAVRGLQDVPAGADQRARVRQGRGPGRPGRAGRREGGRRPAGREGPHTGARIRHRAGGPRDGGGRERRDLPGPGPEGRGRDHRQGARGEVTQ